jgi:hypothetical protein
MGQSEFWRPADYGFWYNLPRTSIFGQIVAILKPYLREQVTILTAPSQNVGCVPGKTGWLRDNGLRYVPVFLGKKKWRLAAPSKLLIDDNEENIEKFAERGGATYLVPSPQNKRHSDDISDLQDVVTEFIHG